MKPPHPFPYVEVSPALLVVASQTPSEAQETGMHTHMPARAHAYTRTCTHTDLKRAERHGAEAEPAPTPSV